jgi:hypothetical protein
MASDFELRGGGLRKLWMSSFRKIYKIIYTNSIEFV